MRRILWWLAALCWMTGARADEHCHDRLETVALGGSCLSGWFVCGGHAGTSLTVPTRFGALPLTLSGSSGRFCCQEFAVWPEHTKVVDGGDRVARVVRVMSGSLVLRECRGERRFLVFTWGKDTCRLVKSVPLGTYLIHHLDPCERSQD